MTQLNDNLRMGGVCTSGQIAFSKKEQMLASYARAMAHPARIAILRYIATNDNCICGDIVDILPLAQSTTSQHLQKLINAGFIKHQNHGPKSFFSIDYDAVESINKIFLDFLNGLAVSQQPTLTKLLYLERYHNKNAII